MKGYELRVFLHVLRKFLYILINGAAPDAVHEGITEGVHLVHRFGLGPALVRHAINGNHRAGAINAAIAVDKNLLAGIVFQDLEEIRRDFIGRTPAIPAQQNQFQVVGRGLVSLLIQIHAAKIDNQIDSHFGEALKTQIRWLRSAIKSWRHLAEIRHTRERDSLGRRVSDCGVLRLGLSVKRGNRCTHAQHDDYDSLQVAELSREPHES